MTQELFALSTAAVAIGVTHTLLGPDHYLPFVALARTRNWGMSRTSLITFLCGLGHVGSSVILGALGLAAGIVVGKLEKVESARGEIAAWLLFIFGCIYALWGLWRFFFPKGHKHLHLHNGGVIHEHPHSHSHPHSAVELNHASSHRHEFPGKESKVSSTPWVLFIIFVFGPCEPLIPLLMYPAAEHNFSGAFLVAGLFSIATVGTMLAVVLTLYSGAKRVRLGILERLSHFIAGLTIALCGVAILFLGL